MADTLKFDFSGFQRAADNLQAMAEQVPFALSRTMNASLVNTKQVLTGSTWPDHVLQRNKGFIGRALKMEFASKTDLSVKITDGGLPGRANLLQHADGGTETGKGNLAIPMSFVRIGASGVVRSQRPRALPNSYREGNRIYQRTGRKGKGKPRLMYVLKRSVAIPKDVPFREDFAASMTAGMRTGFDKAMADAMRTAFKK